jgi:hypothetical protein
MKPIIVLAVMAIAVTGLGAGFLGNTITLDVQSLGVGETNLASPIDDATIKFHIAQIPGNQGNFKNVITDCFIESPQVIVKDSTVYCKLTDANDNVVAEGSRVLPADLPQNTPTVIHIDDPNFIATQVQNIHDVILVVQGPSVAP